jgi:PAS domain S-box-containing protein
MNELTGPRLRTLIAARSDRDAEAMVSGLRNAGLQVLLRRVETMDQFRAALGEQAWRVVIADFDLADFSAPAALATLREAGNQIPFIAVAQDGCAADAIALLRAGAQDCVSPQSPERLALAVMRELANDRERRAFRRAATYLAGVESRLRTTLDCTADGLLLIDANDHVVEFNQRFLELWSLSLSRFHGIAFDELLQMVSSKVKDAGALFRPVKQRRYPAVDQDSDLLELRDGRIIERIARPYLFKGRPAGRVVTFRDVTQSRETEARLKAQYQKLAESRAALLSVIEDQRQAQAARRDSEEQLGRISAATRDAIVQFDDADRVVFWNQAATQMFGYSAEEAIGRDLRELLIPERLRAKHRAGLGRLATAGSLVELCAVRRSGAEFPIEMSLAALRIAEQWHSVAVIRDISARRTAEATLQRINRTLRMLTIGREALLREQDEAALLRRMVDVIVRDGGHPLAWISLMADAPGVFRLAAHSGGEPGILQRLGAFALDALNPDAPLHRVLQTGQPQIIQDIQADESLAFWHADAARAGYRALALLPLRDAGTTIGVLGICAGRVVSFDKHEVRLLRELAESLAFGIATLRLRQAQEQVTERLERSMVATIGAITAIFEARDPHTSGHQFNVARLARAIAAELGLSESEARAIYLASLVHDLGKIQVPIAVLTKPGPLTGGDREILMTHSQAGFEVLDRVDFPWPIARMVLQHHERIDGSGYPDGLRGDAILFSARILAVADVVEAICLDRPHRSGQGIEAALAEIAGNRGTLYDADAADACLRLFREGRFSFDAPDEPAPDAADGARIAAAGTR